MKSSTSSQHISNSLLTNQPQPSNDEEISTYSFRHVTKKLQHAKSYGELYQPQAPLPMPPMTKINNDENEIKHRQKYPSDSPQLLTSTGSRAASTTTSVPIITRPTINSSDETSNLSSNKIPLWKRFKKIIAPSKRNKERLNSSLPTPTLQSNEISTNETSKIVSTDRFFFSYNLQLKNPYIISVFKH
jgi:hypothetical protein